MEHVSGPNEASDWTCLKMEQVDPARRRIRKYEFETVIGTPEVPPILAKAS